MIIKLNLLQKNFFIVVDKKRKKINFKILGTTNE